jgi:hypothetical protein
MQIMEILFWTIVGFDAIIVVYEIMKWIIKKGEEITNEKN